MDTSLHIEVREVALTAIRAQGPGGQNGNKVFSAISFDLMWHIQPYRKKLSSVG